MKLTASEDTLPAIIKQVHDLARRKVQVGAPASTAARNGGALTNADLAYIHENGAPGANIPARPFLVPGIQESGDRIGKQMEKAARAALANKPDQVEQALHGAGVTAQSGVRGKINEGPFEALAEATLAARQRRGRTGDKPLIDTGQLRNSITYVIKDS